MTVSHYDVNMNEYLADDHSKFSSNCNASKLVIFTQTLFSLVKGFLSLLVKDFPEMRRKRTDNV
jgi:hypothetical protein